MPNMLLLLTPAIRFTLPLKATATPTPTPTAPQRILFAKSPSLLPNSQEPTAKYCPWIHMEGIDPTSAEERLPNPVAELHQLQQGLDILGRTHGDSK
jgi:hypothetical protein